MPPIEASAFFGGKMRWSRAVAAENQNTWRHMKSIYFLHCAQFDHERQELQRSLKKILHKNKIFFHSVKMEEMLGEHDFNLDDAKEIRLQLIKFLTSTGKHIWNKKKALLSFWRNINLIFFFFYLLFYLFNLFFTLYFIFSLSEDLFLYC